MWDGYDSLHGTYALASFFGRGGRPIFETVSLTVTSYVRCLMGQISVPLHVVQPHEDPTCSDYSVFLHFLSRHITLPFVAA